MQTLKFEREHERIVQSDLSILSRTRMRPRINNVFETILQEILLF
jgi:hypothetical protein